MDSSTELEVIDFLIKYITTTSQANRSPVRLRPAVIPQDIIDVMSTKS